MTVAGLTYRDNPLINPLSDLHTIVKKNWESAGVKVINGFNENRIEKNITLGTVRARTSLIVKAAFGYLALGAMAFIGLLLNPLLLRIVTMARTQQREQAIDGFALNLLSQLVKENPRTTTKVMVAIEYGNTNFYCSELVTKGANVETVVAKLKAKVTEVLSEQPLHKTGRIKWTNIHQISRNQFRLSNGMQSLEFAGGSGAGLGGIQRPLERAEINEESFGIDLVKGPLPEKLFNIFGYLTSGYSRSV